jgi:signal transduction histidine kinase
VDAAPSAVFVVGPAAPGPSQARRNGQAVLSVQDTGINVTWEALVYVSEPFFTSKGRAKRGRREPIESLRHCDAR